MASISLGYNDYPRSWVPHNIVLWNPQLLFESPNFELYDLKYFKMLCAGDYSNSLGVNIKTMTDCGWQMKSCLIGWTLKWEVPLLEWHDSTIWHFDEK